MKPKGINFFELHVEKIVLGVAGAIVLGLAAMAFLTNPNSVRLGGHELPPADVDRELAAKANALRGRLGGGASDDLEVTVERLSDWFEEQRDHPLGEQPPAMAVALTRPGVVQIGSGGALAGTTDRYAEIVPPAPTGLRVEPRAYTIDARDIELNPDLASRFAQGATHDLSVVHVLADFNGKELRTHLSTPHPDRRNVPSQWVEQDMMILDVQAERQMLQSDGTWSSPEPVGPIPGQPTLRDRYPMLTFADKDLFLDDAVALGTDLYQPPFYALSDGTPWTIEALERGAPKSDELQTAERRMKSAWDKVLHHEKRLERFLKAQEEDSRSPTGDSGSKGAGRGGGGPEGGGQGFGDEGGEEEEEQDDERPKKTAEELARERIERDIEQALKVYEDAKEEVLAVSPNYDAFPDEDGTARPGGRETDFPRGRGDDTGKGGRRDYPIGDEMGGPEGRPSPEGMSPEGMGGKGGRGYTAMTSAASNALFDQEKVQVWAHDLDVKPGMTYRYRLQVAFYNPYFGREARLAESQKSLAASPVVLSEPTEWSAPVRVHAQQQFFVTKASYGAALESRTASFEIYAFTNGQHRLLNFTARPGDAIGEPRTIAADEVEIEDEAQVEPEEQFGPEGGGMRVARGGEEEEDEEDSEANATEVQEPTVVDFFTGAVLLDVVPLPNTGNRLEQPVRVVVAMSDGSILTFDPEQQVKDPDRLRLRELAGRG